MSTITRVSALYIHGPKSSRPEDRNPTPMFPVSAVEAVETMGLREDARFFRAQVEGEDRKRQVSLIDEGTIWKLEKEFGQIDRAFIKAQILLQGELRLSDLIGHRVTFASGATFLLAMARVPCFAMDLIAPGVRDAMAHGNQGALARVVTSGRIAVGDGVVVSSPELVDVTAGWLVADRAE